MPVKPAVSSLEHKSYWKSAYSLSTKLDCSQAQVK